MPGVIISVLDPVKSMQTSEDSVHMRTTFRKIDSKSCVLLCSFYQRQTQFPVQWTHLLRISSASSRLCRPVVIMIAWDANKSNMTGHKRKLGEFMQTLHKSLLGWDIILIFFQEYDNVFQMALCKANHIKTLRPQHCRTPDTFLEAN